VGAQLPEVCGGPRTTVVVDEEKKSVMKKEFFHKRTATPLYQNKKAWKKTHWKSTRTESKTGMSGKKGWLFLFCKKESGKTGGEGNSEEGWHAGRAQGRKKAGGRGGGRKLAKARTCGVYATKEKGGQPGRATATRIKAGRIETGEEGVGSSNKTGGGREKIRRGRDRALDLERA